MQRGILLLLAISAIAPYLHLDAWRTGMLLVYPPRLAYLAIGLTLCATNALQRGWQRAAAAALITAPLVFTLGWGGHSFRTSPPPQQALPDDGGSPAVLRLLSLNTHNSRDVLDALRRLVDRERIDILVLQEIRLNRREPLRRTFSDFEFYSVDPPPPQERKSTGVYASITGVRKTLLDQDVGVALEAAITGYRSFAIRPSIRGRRLWIVNVHATKPVWMENGFVKALAGLAWSSRWHLEEGSRLRRWTKPHLSDPMILAGDFNAPHYADTLRIDGLHQAHRSAGRGLHLTWPRWLPVWGIDHVLATNAIRFTSCRVVDGGPSDHLAQLVEFELTRPPLAETRRTCSPAGDCRWRGTGIPSASS